MTCYDLNTFIWPPLCQPKDSLGLDNKEWPSLFQWPIFQNLKKKKKIEWDKNDSPYIHIELFAVKLNDIW